MRKWNQDLDRLVRDEDGTFVCSFDESDLLEARYVRVHILVVSFCSLGQSVDTAGANSVQCVEKMMAFILGSSLELHYGNTRGNVQRAVFCDA